MPGKTYETSSNHGIPGHVALQVGTEYCSFWPARNKKGGRENLGVIRPSAADFKKISYESDAEGMEYEADDAVELEGLNEKSVLREWKNIKGRSIKYQLLNVNCCTVSTKLLQTGFINTSWGQDFMESHAGPNLRQVMDSASTDVTDVMFLTPTSVLFFTYLIKNASEDWGYTERQVRDLVKQKFDEAHPLQQERGWLGAWLEGLFG